MQSLYMQIRIGVQILLTGLIIVSMFSSCQKPSTGNSKNAYPIPQTVKDYSSFKSGTYWVYRDSASGKLDSQYVSAYKAGYDTTQSIYLNGYFEYYIYYVNDNSDTTTYYYNIGMTWSTTGTDVIGFNDCSNSKGPVGQITFLIYPFSDISNRYGENNDTVRNITQYNTIAFQGNAFNNVVKVHHANDITQGLQPTNYYLADHIGIIRIERLKARQIWNLLRYKIVQ